MNERVTYRHTHTSAHDGSPAMLVSQDAETITLVNEDGHEWTDPLVDWCPIGGGQANARDPQQAEIVAKAEDLLTTLALLVPSSTIHYAVVEAEQALRTLIRTAHGIKCSEDQSAPESATNAGGEPDRSQQPAPRSRLCHCGTPAQGDGDYPDVCSQWPLCETRPSSVTDRSSDAPASQ